MCVCILVYGYVLYYISTTIVNTINVGGSKEYTMSIDINNFHKISFREAQVHIRPFQSGVKVIGITEEGSGYLISHSVPVLIYYDFLSQKLKFTYEGESVAQYKPIESQFGAKITGKYSLEFDLKLTDIFSSIKNNYDNFLGLLNTNMASYVIQDVSCIDTSNNTLIFSQKILSGTLSLKNKGHYTSLQDFLNNIPQEYSVDFQIDSSMLSGEKKNIAPSSFIYGLLLPTNISLAGKLQMQTISKLFSVEEILKYMILSMNVDSAAIDGQTAFKFNLKTEVIDPKNQNIVLSLDLNSACKDCTHKMLKEVQDYIKLLENVQEVVNAKDGENGNNQNISNKTGTSAIKKLNDFARLINILYKNDQNILNSMKMQLDANYANKDNKININVQNMKLWVGDSGIQVDGKISNGENQWSLVGKGQINIFDNNHVIESIAEYVAPSALPRIPVDVSEEILRKYFTEALMSISDYPDSDNNKEIIIAYEFDTDRPGEAKIGLTSLQVATQKLTQKFYTRIFEYCLQFEDPMSKLAEISPNLKIEQPQIFGAIQKSYQTIKDHLKKSDSNELDSNAIPKGSKK